MWTGLVIRLDDFTSLTRLNKKKKHHAFIFNTSDFLSTWTFSASSALQEPAAEMQTASSSSFF